MTREEAINQLMQEWRAGEQYRPFFTRVVDDYMGIAKSVLISDLQNIRGIINKMK